MIKVEAKPIRALVIPSQASLPVKEVQLDGDLLKRLQALVGGHIEGVALRGRNDVVGYINEDGKMLGLGHNERATRIAWIDPRDSIVGAMVLLGRDGPDEISAPSDVTADLTCFTGGER